MSTACGRPQGGGGPAHVDICGHGEGGVKNLIFCGCHKWMANNLQRRANGRSMSRLKGEVSGLIALMLLKFKISITNR